MNLSVVHLDFPGIDSEKAFEVLKQLGASGFVAGRGGVCSAIILNEARVMNGIYQSSVLKHDLSIHELRHIRTGQFLGLQHVFAKSRDGTQSQLFCDKVTPNGLLVGWGRASNGQPCKIRISVDRKAADTALIDCFRLDLLRAGVGNGCHGFSVRLPDWALDGRQHRIDIEMVYHDQPEGAALASCTKVLDLPFHFNLDRPWIGEASLHAGYWDNRKEAEYIDIRTDILAGRMDHSLARAKLFIDENPQAIFLDFGIKDRCLIDNKVFETFQSRLRNRWAVHFGAQACDRGEECCKALTLPYNVNAAGAQEASPATRISEADPWHEAGPLDNCPLKIRHFASKRLTRDYAQKHGIRVPKTLATLRNIADFDAFSFPNRYVLKPDFASGVGLYLMNDHLNLFNGFSYSKEAIRSEVEKFFHQNAQCEFVVEEFVQQEGVDSDLPIVPLDYKIHCFGGKGRIIQIDDKNAISRDTLHRRQSWLSRDWSLTRAPFRQGVEHPNDPIRPPMCLPEMLEMADRICTDLGDYVRVDLYATDDGPVLGEVTSYSHSGLGFSDYANIILGQAWAIFEDA